MFADCISNDCLQACHLVTNSGLVKKLPDRRDPTQNSIGGSVGVPLADRDRNQPPKHQSASLQPGGASSHFEGTGWNVCWHVADHFPNRFGKIQGQVQRKVKGDWLDSA